jgi:hypothetical protein
MLDDVVVEFAIGKGALLLLDERGDDDVDDVNDVDDEVVFWVEVVVFLAEDVMVLGELDELEETMVEEPVPVGLAVVVELPIVKGALLVLELELVSAALIAVGPVETVLLFPMVKRAEPEGLSREEVAIQPVDMAVDDVSFPAGNGAVVLLDRTVDDEVVFRVDGAEEEDWERLEDPMPVGPAEEIVLLPMVKRAELEELRLD